MKTLLTCIVIFTTAIFVLRGTPVFAQGEGTKVGDKIEKYIDNLKTASTDQEKAQKELKEAIKKAKEANPDNAEKVKEDFYEAAKKIRDKYKKNQETFEWLKEFLTKLLDNDLVAMLPNLNDLTKLATVKAIGTGRTTGHIANLSIQNNTDNPIKAQIGPLFIPSDGQYHPYIVPTPIRIIVNPGATTTAKLNGYCTDIHLPPVPENKPMPPIDSWLEQPSAGMDLPENWQPQTNQGWQPLSGTDANNVAGDGRPQLLVPGTNRPLNHTINQITHPKEAAPILLSAINEITEAYENMSTSEEINTPFKGNPEKERESVIQQTFWIYTAALTGTVYKLSDFEKKTHEQFEKSTGNKVSGLNPEQKKELDKGVNDFWNTFQAVGAEAKVILLADDGEQEVSYDKVNKRDDLPKLIIPGYDRYTVERVINKKSHEEAMKKAFSSEAARKKWSEHFKRIYGK